MKKYSLILILLVVNKLIYSQCEDRFAVALVNYTIKGVGVEVGKWHTVEQKWGHFYGAEIQWVKIIVDKEGNKSTIPPNTIAYYKIQRRIIDYVAISSSIGIQGIENIYLGIGLRTYLPLHPGRKSIIIFEPTYSNLGFRTIFGLAIAL